MRAKNTQCLEKIDPYISGVGENKWCCKKKCNLAPILYHSQKINLQLIKDLNVRHVTIKRLESNLRKKSL